MSVKTTPWFYLVVIISLMSLITPVTGDRNSEYITYGDDEDWPDQEEFSGSGDSPSRDDDPPRETTGGQGRVIDLALPVDPGLNLHPQGAARVQDSRSVKIITSDTVHVEPSDSLSETKSGIGGKNFEKTRTDSPTKTKKTKKSDNKKRKKKKKTKNKPKQEGKTLNLATSKSSVKLKGKTGNSEKVEDDNVIGVEKNHHIRGNINDNNHQDKPRRRHQNGHHKKRWRKNRASNRHGFGSKGTSKKRKLTFEDRWPGCFSKYQSCYRDTNCCNNHCKQFTWLSFGFCL